MMMNLFMIVLVLATLGTVMLLFKVGVFSWAMYFVAIAFIIIVYMIGLEDVAKEGRQQEALDALRAKWRYRQEIER